MQQKYNNNCIFTKYIHKYSKSKYILHKKGI